MGSLYFMGTIGIGQSSVKIACKGLNDYTSVQLDPAFVIGF